jgi:hypothetical protein
VDLVEPDLHEGNRVKKCEKCEKCEESITDRR